MIEQDEKTKVSPPPFPPKFDDNDPFIGRPDTTEVYLDRVNCLTVVMGVLSKAAPDTRRAVVECLRVLVD